MNDRNRLRMWNNDTQSYFVPTTLEDLGIGERQLWYDDGSWRLGHGETIDIELCVGKQDHTGKWAFDGDIIREVEQDWTQDGKWVSEEWHPLLQIEWGAAYAGSMFNAVTKEGHTQDFYGGIPDRFEIIGNIRENPELMEVVNDEPSEEA